MPTKTHRADAPVADNGRSIEPADADDGFSVPTHIANLPARFRREWHELSTYERRALGADAFDRWTRDLHVDDYTLADIVELEKKRHRALQTMRAASDLTDQEFQLLRFLQRHEGHVMSYLRIARHLWETARGPIPASQLKAAGGYASPIVTAIQVLVLHLRRKIEIDPLRPQHIATIRGVGYVWYSLAPALDDGVNYERRAAHATRLRDEMYALIGSYDAPIHPEIARELDPTLGPYTGDALDAAYRAVEDRPALPDGRHDE